MVQNQKSAADRLIEARRDAGYEKATDAARALGISPPTYLGHENGSRGFQREAPRYAQFFGVSLEWLITGKGTKTASAEPKEIRAGLVSDLSGIDFSMPQRSIIPATTPVEDLLPVVGTAEGGPDGLLHWNGDVIEQVKRPPHLASAKGAYALYVSGSSMEPRYFAGEIIYVHPGKPVFQNCFVVVQFARENDGPTPAAWVKQLIRNDGRLLHLRQFNPAKNLTLPIERVLAIHRIVGSGES